MLRGKVALSTLTRPGFVLPVKIPKLPGTLSLLFFKVRDLEAAGALITMSADTGVACLAQLLPGLFCKAFHLPEQCLSLNLLLLTLIVGT